MSKYSKLTEGLRKSGNANFADKITAFSNLIKSHADLHSSINSYKEYRNALKHADKTHSADDWKLEKASGNEKVRGVADSYAASKGLKLDHNIPTHNINPEHATKIAHAYESMKHDPSHPVVKAAYDALANETVDQLKHIRNNGLKLSRIKQGQENPYKNGSKDLNHDITNNNHMWYYPTEQGFGSGEAHTAHPLLKPTSETHDGHTLLANDAFRIVHDYFGHAKEGHSFGPKGEDNAWKHHMQMYSPEAQKALTSETRGQNSWVNFGPHGEANRKNPGNTTYAPQKAGLLPHWAMEHAPAAAKDKDEKLAASEAGRALDKAQGPCWEGYEKVPGKEKYEKGSCRSIKKKVKESKSLKKGQDENGNPIHGSNKRLQQAKVFGKPSDVKVDKKGVAHSKIPDANGARTSPQRMKMMNHIKTYAEKKMGLNMTVAEGKRDESGKLKTKAPIEKEPFNVFSAKGHAEEKKRNSKIKEINASKPAGEKPIKRLDPKPDHRSGNLETQPSPDAAIHEIAHEVLAPKGMGIKEHQTHMDKLWGQHQIDHGHMQQKKTAGEIQPMAAENLIRREIGLPANRATKPTDKKLPVAQAIDGTGPRFVRGKDHKGNAADYDRQSKLLHPANKERIEQLRDGRLKHDGQNGIKDGTSPNAKINARAAAPKNNVTQMPKQKPQKLAASEAVIESANKLSKALTRTKK